MDNAVKKVASYILVTVVIISTIIAILSVWGLIDLEDVIWKIMQTLFVVFVAAILVLFIYNILLREPFKKNDDD